MAEREELLRAVQGARTGRELAAAVAALDDHDQARTAAIARSRETDLSATAVRATLEPVPLYERHTAATDWLGEYEPPSDYRTAMIAEASRWYRSVSPEVAADPEEFAEQALGRAYTAASAYGDHALAARREFMTYFGYLTRQGASGLPQIQQTVDGDNQPAQTPLPPEPFDNFAPEQNPLNAGVESPNRQSQISSGQAPGIQELESQNAGGSGFGSGPERPDTHTTSMDTADSYAEVPLGPPGQIPTAPPGAAPSAPSAQNPAMGMEDNDEGMQQRQGSMSVAAYTRPDYEGFRWHIGPDQDVDTFATPYHEKCGSLHWPEEPCHRGQEHTASVAVGYLMNAEDFARRARFESGGMAEGDAVLRRTAGDRARLAAHHSALMAGFRVQARTEDEIAWLHGYLARVRPVLAGGSSCPGCGGKAGKNGGLCTACLQDSQKARGKKKKGKGKGQLPVEGASRLDFLLAAEAAADGDSVPLRICPQCGSTYCKHWQGRDEPYDLPGQPYGTGEKTSSLAKGAPFAGYEDFASCVRANSDKDSPDAYCGYIKHKVEDKGKSKESARIRLTASDLAAASAELQRLAASSLPQVQEFVDSHDSPDPQGDQLNTAVMFPLLPAFGGQGQEDGQGKEAARRSMTPSSAAVRMFGQMDAMDGKRPRHKDSYPFSTKAHGQYMRGWNNTRGSMDAVLGRDPISAEDYEAWTGRPDLHKHYLGVYSQVKAGRSGTDIQAEGMRRQADGFGSHLDPRCDCTHEPGRPCDESCPVHGRQQKEGVRRQADFMTRPHQSTDDLHAPFNSAATSPEPWSSSEQGGDYDQGVRDGQEDARAGEHPTFADNSALVSPYVKGYAVGYSGRPPDTGVQDVPRSMGGDSGQAMNEQAAQTAFQVSKASLQRRAAQCYGCPHPAHRTEPCSAVGCRHLHNPGEEGAGPGMHARQIGHVPDPASPGYSMPPPGRRADWEDAYEGSGNRDDDAYEGWRTDYGRYSSLRRQGHDFTESEREHAKHSLGPDDKLPVNSLQDLKNAHTRAHQVKGIPESTVDAYLDRLDKEYDYGGGDSHAHDRRAAGLRPVSAAFLTRQAIRDPDFRKGYKFAARWQPGARLVAQGSAAFEAGLYAAISDRPGIQEAWAREHRRLSRRHPVLGARLDAHVSFTRKLALTDRGRYRVSGSGCYPVRRQAVWAGGEADCGHEEAWGGHCGQASCPNYANACPKHNDVRPDARQRCNREGQQRTAGTSVDLITDGPGTSPDPMGSTPLNGVGTPPPMGGGEDPARSGGPSPYQGAQPQGSGPVAPDDVLGRPQEPPQRSGPMTQTFSGRHPENADLAPAAPNTAGGPGYENTDAYQGDPQRYQQAMAFRRRVQASLAASRAG